MDSNIPLSPRGWESQLICFSFLRRIECLILPYIKCLTIIPIVMHILHQAALRQITDKAREFGAGPLFNQILPLLMSPTLEDQERHLLVKVIDRILYKLDDLVRPYVHKILVVIEPLLIDEDYYARVEGREIISNLAKVRIISQLLKTLLIVYLHICVTMCVCLGPF